MWSTSFPVVRLAARSMPPFALSAGRAGVFGSAVPVTLFLSLAQRARATDAAMTGYLQPGFAAVFAALLLGEFPETRVLLGGAVVLAGVWLATGGGRRSP